MKRKPFVQRPPALPRNPRERHLIVTEGTHTEVHYFKALKQHFRVNADVHSAKASDPLSVVKSAIQRREEAQKRSKKSLIDETYDKIWCVFDVDGAEGSVQFMEALDLAKGEKLEVILSNPCFEIWYILHFEFTTRPFTDAEEVKRHLRTSLDGYTESSQVFSELAPLTDKALTHSRRLRTHHLNLCVPSHSNPSTHVDELVEIFRQNAPST